VNWSTRRRIIALITSALVVGVVIALVAWLSAVSNRRRARTIRLQDQTTDIAAATPLAATSASPIDSPPAPTPAGKLLIPVIGVKPEQLRDTFAEARSEGRVHDAIDIPAAKGTPVIAAADGKIVKLAPNERGGTTIYQISSDGKFVYYYAHLDRYAEGLAEGHFATQGETIAYVGDTGNAGAGNYHLHFSVAWIANPKNFWHGINVNPYPLLTK
jgi:murein DD-endopeptidase MepM/ murein hydrolase activator NlpD